MNLADGAVVLIDSVKSFKLPEEASGWVAFLKEEPKKKKEVKSEKEESEEEKKGTAKSEKGKGEDEEQEKKEEKKKDYGTPLVLQSLSDTAKTADGCLSSKSTSFEIYVGCHMSSAAHIKYFPADSSNTLLKFFDAPKFLMFL